MKRVLASRSSRAETFVTLFWLLMFWVGLMSGIFSIGREVANLFWPNRIPGTDLFWTCTKIAAIASMFALWMREKKLRNKLEHPIESPKSLRRRILLLVEEIDVFYKKREAGTPPFYLNDDECARKIGEYRTETQILAEARFKQPIREIAREIQAKGVDTNMLPMPGFDLVDFNTLPREEHLQFLRNLSYRIDHNDDAVRF